MGRKKSPFSLSFGKDGVGFGMGAAGFGITKRPGGGGSVSFPGGMKMEVVNKGCYIVKLFYVFGQYTHSDIEKKPKCDEDDDDNQGNDESKPPHCIGSDGKSGKGSPKNLLPECLNDGKVHDFYWRPSAQTGGQWIHYDNRDSDSYWVRIFQDKFFGFNEQNQLVAHSTDSSIKRTKDGEEFTVGYDSGLVVLTSKYLRNYFRGTYDELTTYLSNYTYEFQGHIVQGLPGTNTETVKFPKSDYIRDNWAYAWVVSPDAVGKCNPTGNEGCNNGNSSGNDDDSKNDRNSPRFPKRPGGLKPPSKGDRGDDMADCCAKIMKRLGLDKFPGKLPKSLLETEDNEPVKIETLTDLLLYLMDSLDERLGKYPIDVKIKDVNPFKKGEQSETLSFPNISEILAESYGLQFKTALDSQINQTIITNLLIENGLQKAALTRIENVLEEFIEYFGWDVKESTTKIDIPYTPGKRNFDELLERSKLEVKRIDRKIDKDNPAFDQMMEVLLEAAAIIKQVNWRKINPNGNVASQIADYARLGLDIYREVKDKKSDDWEEFKKMVEDGYGQFNVGERVDKSDLPTIREINKQSSTDVRGR
ncbi:MAG: hypothetical protein VKK42_02495 [Lyngbya sp.]|nr:hypothetical protein [Lyngbya sp.]